MHLVAHNNIQCPFYKKSKKVFAFFLKPCFKILVVSTFSRLVLLVTADLQVCGVYSFRIDVSVKSSFTHVTFPSRLNGGKV